MILRKWNHIRNLTHTASSILTYEPILESTFLNKLIHVTPNSVTRKKKKKRFIDRFSNSHLGNRNFLRPPPKWCWPREKEREREQRRGMEGWIDEGWILNEARALTGPIIETPGSDLNRADWFHSPHRIWQRSSGWRGRAPLPLPLYM